MNILNKLKNNDCNLDDLLNCLNSFSPIILYETMLYIIRNNINNIEIVNKLLLLSNLLDENDKFNYKMIGAYKIGHFAMATLLIIGINEKIVFKSNLSEFNKNLVYNLLKNI